MSRVRVLITGFGPFPGAPYNPTQPLVARLVRAARPNISSACGRILASSLGSS